MYKKINVLMLAMIMAQYLIPTSYAASEITSYISDVASEVTSDVTSETIESEATSEETSEVSNITREDSEVADSEISTDETSELETITSETESQALTEEEIMELAKAMEPESKVATMPYPAYNVMNFDAPAGYFVPEESTLYGYANGHKRVSIEDATWRDVPNDGKGYLDLGDGGKGQMDPDTGEISHEWCGDQSDDKIRFECAGMFFPLDTTLGGGQGYTPGTNEHDIANSDTIVIYYPEALIVNGTKYDVKAKFTDFLKTSDSLGNSNDGWYTTFAVSHYLYDGYWLNDFQKVTEEMQIFNSETGAPINLADLKVYDFRFGMQSLNHSADDYGYASKLTAEAIRPLSGLDESTVVQSCFIEKTYNTLLGGEAYQGMTGDECNGVSFNTTDTNTIEFGVAKYPSSEATYDGYSYWEIAWFVPIFWATRLPTNYTDAGDAPAATYGNGEIQIDGDEITRSQFYLGGTWDSNPSNDEQTDIYGHDNGLNDDNNPTDAENFDDETSLDAYLDEDGSGFITFEPTGSTIDLEIPYNNLYGYEGQIIVWLDFDDNGKFDENEATAVRVSGVENPGTVSMSLNIPDDAKNADTYIRVLITDDLSNLTAKGNSAVFPGIGEVEDYPVRLRSDSLISKSVSDEDGDSSVSIGETLTYTITVSNTSASIPVTNVEVKDSLLQNLPSWLEFNDDVSLSPDHATSGSLVDGDFIIHEIPAGGSVNITFSVTLVAIPDGITNVVNIVTDNGQDPTDPGFICDEAAQKVDCDKVTVPIIGATTIEKAIINETGTEDGIAEYGEDITYQLSIDNPTSSPAYDIQVRDSLLENLPSWMTVIDGPNIGPDRIVTTGSLALGNFGIESIGAGETVTITYTIHISEIPTNVTDITNVATDNGEDPATVDPETCAP